MLDRGQIPGALELEHAQLHAGVERGGEQDDPHGEGLAHPGLGTDKHGLEHQGQEHRAAALVDPERDRPEQVRADPPLASGHGLGFAAAMSWSPTHSTSRPACASEAGSGHTQPERAAQAGRELVAALDDVDRSPRRAGRRPRASRARPS